MAKTLSKTEATKTLGVSGQNTRTGNFYSDEFLPQLRGQRAIKTFRTMRDNDATIGAVLYAAEQVLRDVKFKVVPSDKENEQSIKEAKFVESILDDMEHTLDDHISEALSFLTYGFSWFEVVYKRRVGPYEKNPKKKSHYTDGRIGVRKLASRAPWTVNKFDVDQITGDVLGIFQNSYNASNNNYIPTRKSVYYRTTVINGDPAGRSILRNAYTSYDRLQGAQNFEMIGVERDLAGIPVGRIPADYLAEDATDDQKAIKRQMEEILRDFKVNEQSYLLLPSDMHYDKDGSPTNHPLVDVSLMSSEGTRSINMDTVIRRYQHDIARSVLSEFIMLGAGGTGSYALSKSKTDIFLRTLESYIQTITDVLNKQLVERLWELNGLDYDLMPKIKAGDIAPHDLKDLGSYLRNLNGAGIPLRDQVDIVDELFEIAELPKLNRDTYDKSLEQARETEQSRNEYYNDTPKGEKVPDGKDQNKDEDE